MGLSSSPSQSSAQRMSVGLIVELVGFFFFSPLLILGGIWPARYKMAMLAAASLWAVGVVLVNKARRDELGFGPAARASAWPCIRAALPWWAAFVVAIVALRWWNNSPVLTLPITRPGLFIAIVFLYSLSVIVQEFVFRSFFFWRYRTLAPLASLVTLNIISFGWIHIVFGSWISVALTLVGGALFTWLYIRHRSYMGVCIVHAMFGLVLFATGFGSYFHGGSERLATFMAALWTSTPPLGLLCAG